MNRPVVFRGVARAEFDEAVAWYERQAGLGADLLAAVRQGLDRVAEAPERYPVVYKDVRRILIRRFPYLILYRIESERIVVIAVFHSSRDPKAWQSRA